MKRHVIPAAMLLATAASATAMSCGSPPSSFSPAEPPAASPIRKIPKGATKDEIKTQDDASSVNASNVGGFSVEENSPPETLGSSENLGFSFTRHYSKHLEFWLGRELPGESALERRMQVAKELGAGYTVVLVDETARSLKHLEWFQKEQLGPTTSHTDATTLLENDRANSATRANTTARMKGRLRRSRPLPKGPHAPQFEAKAPCGYDLEAEVNERKKPRACGLLVMKGGLEKLAPFVATETEFEPSAEVFYTMATHWNEEYGAELVVWSRNPVFAIERPPQSLRTLREFAWEFYLVCPMAPEGWSSADEDPRELLGRLGKPYGECGWFSP